MMTQLVRIAAVCLATCVYLSAASTSSFAQLTSLAVSNFDAVRHVSQFPGANAGDMINNALDDLPATGGVVDARGLGTTAAITSNIVVSKSNVTLLLGVTTFTVTSGVQVLITGADVAFIGVGDGTHFNASAGTASASLFRVNGDRALLQRFKITGNRAAGGTSTAVQVGFAAPDPDSTRTGIRVEYLTIVDAGNYGIFTRRTDNFRAAYNRITSPRLTGIWGDRSIGWRVESNTIIDPNPGNIMPHGAIHCASGNIATHRNLWITDNDIRFTGTGFGTGVQCNAVEHVWIMRNRIVGATGEGIAFTANYAQVAYNQVQNSGPAGILFYATTEGFANADISHNMSWDNSQGVSVVWGANNVTIQNVTISYNRAFDTVGGSVQTYGLQTRLESGETGTAVKNFAIYNNLFVGNSIGAYNLLTTTGSYTILGNSEVDNDERLTTNTRSPFTVLQTRAGTSGVLSTETGLHMRHADTSNSANLSETRLQLGFDTITNNQKWGGIGARRTAAFANQGELAFYTWNSGVPSGVIERMTLKASGFLGIGTSAPNAKLEVDGLGVFQKRITDPCTVAQEGGIFYNTTSDYLCYCDGTLVAKRAHDPLTSCF